MKHLVLVMLLATATSSHAVAAEEAANEEEAAIKKAIASYVEAFNKGDAKALAVHWTERGEFITPGQKKLQGREELEQEFTAYFAESKGATLVLEDTAVELRSPSVAVETGIARVVVSGDDVSETTYEATHVRTAEGWKIDSLREQELPPPPLSHHDKLQDLQWMIGEWVDADEGSVIETSCRWTTNQNFIVRSFKVFIEDRVDFAGTQIIGWDPAAETIRSWMFDSDGGFGVGRWSGDGGRWKVQMVNVLADGRRASATNIFQQVDEDTVTFKSIGRQVNGELLPNIGPVNVVRAAE